MAARVDYTALAVSAIAAALAAVCAVSRPDCNCGSRASTSASARADVAACAALDARYDRERRITLYAGP